MDYYLDSVCYYWKGGNPFWGIRVTANYLKKYLLIFLKYWEGGNKQSWAPWPILLLSCLGKVEYRSPSLRLKLRFLNKKSSKNYTSAASISRETVWASLLPNISKPQSVLERRKNIIIPSNILQGMGNNLEKVIKMISN